MVYDNIKIEVELLNGAKRIFNIDTNCYISDIYTLLLKFSFKYKKYALYNNNEIIDIGTREEIAEKLEESIHPGKRLCL